ncbi:hypothetical protein OPV22_031354 [Ensete ventricosum]|uniref:Uncharacterized protein n=1 Tax=Ensete ventricosum TaxID=4639 RepID=A0AAV8PP57_ENSVE|nr:hypothetical protein OPV22_031354 [Ensete ventricosum]RWW28055.1 hypothetical protein GW17_00007486 [Ensete ventricosum]RWW68615.1 hypothetical protein BHE74_00023854 [Ensete ventricosum]
MPDSYFPLRWESTGDQWWYASPVDWAAANGHYDLVRQLLHLDANLLIKLTSLRRIRRLETVWDDDARFVDAARCRSTVARRLLHECEGRNGNNSLMRAGYGGWLLYTAASAGDMGFVQELLHREPLLVFGEGEYGVTDIFYAAARSKTSEVFRLLFDSAVSPRRSIGGGGGGADSGFRWEMVNRALHAAARGGSLEFLKELMVDCSDVVAYRDIQGSTILHTASGRGQVEVVKYLLASIDMIDSRDKKGNTALHIAAFRGHLSVAEALMAASPSSSRSINEAGDTFLHMAVAGFRTPGFRRLDRQMELVRKLIDGNAASIQGIVNVRNKDGRTALHMAVIGNVHADLVELLMTVRSIDLNVRDGDGMTPLDVLRQHPRSASSEVLIKQLISAGGMANSKDYRTRSAIASHLKMQGVANSPGTGFRVSDAEILVYTGIQASDASARPSSCSSASKSEVSHFSAGSDRRKRRQMGSIGDVARHLRVLMGWPRRRGKTAETLNRVGDDESLESFKKLVDGGEAPTPLRQQFSKSAWMVMMMASNKRPLSVRSGVPSPATRKKFAASSSAMEKRKGICLENENDGASCSSSSMNYSAVENATPRWSLVNARMMNQYLCFGAQHMEEADEQQPNHASKPSLVSAI